VNINLLMVFGKRPGVRRMANEDETVDRPERLRDKKNLFDDLDAKGTPNQIVGNVLPKPVS